MYCARSCRYLMDWHFKGGIGTLVVLAVFASPCQQVAAVSTEDKIMDKGYFGTGCGFTNVWESTANCRWESTPVKCQKTALKYLKGLKVPLPRRG
jgi:hypothetical protein